MISAHPRSRGENRIEAAAQPISAGSSPLTRGKRRSADAAELKVRLIPAHAGKTHNQIRGQSGSSAHPRSRGENWSMARTTSLGMGSSPLTRGKRARRARALRKNRLIPAHAGKTWRNGHRRNGARAHPRSRGENMPQSSLTSPSRGSSPLTRGKREQQGSWRPTRRLIPAHAGKTLPDLRFYCADRSDLGNP